MRDPGDQTTLDDPAGLQQIRQVNILKTAQEQLVAVVENKAQLRETSEAISLLEDAVELHVSEAPDIVRPSKPE